MNTVRQTALGSEPDDHKLSAIIRGFIDGVTCLDAVMDTDGDVRDFIVTDVNERAALLFNQPRKHLVGQLLTRVIPESRTKYALPRIKEVFLTGKSKEIEEELVVDDIPHQVIQQIIPFATGVLVVVKDVTETHRAQVALRDSQEYLSSVIANAPIIIYELDCEGNFKLSAGRSLEQIGLAAGEAVGQSIFAFFDQDSPEVIAFEKALKGKTVNTQTQLGEGFFTSRYTPRFDEKGKIVGVLGVSYDITEQYHAEQRLHQAQRLEAVGQLTGGIAHDFNNLLAVIVGNLDLLGTQTNLDVASQDLINQAISATQRGSMLTKRLLAFSRQQVLEPRSTDISTLLNGMLELLGRTFTENINISCHAAAELWQVHIDPSQLENAVLNLCVNARDAMPQGGQLDITASNHTLDDKRASPLGLAPGEYVKVSVKDNGCGIPEDAQKLVFEPFFSTKEAGKGSGLGLSMVYGFVDQSGGAIGLASEVGVGSQFDLYLPRSTEEAKFLEKKLTSDSSTIQGHGEHVLVVEDDAAVRELVEKILRSLNYTVSAVENADVAFGLLDQQANFDLLFSDIVLPGELSGIQLARQAQSMYPQLKVLMTSGYARDHDQIDLAALPQLHLIKKPYHLEELGRELRRILDR